MNAAAAGKLVLSPGLAGTLMTPEEFDAADVDGDAEVYELINGVLIVSPPPLEEERDPNDELGFLLRIYRRQHPLGKALDRTLAQQRIQTRRNRRIADRVIWAGLGRMPKRDEVPTIAVEFVSKDRRDRTRDYDEKKREYREINVQEYWIIDRFRRHMIVVLNMPEGPRELTIRENEVYRTPVLPGFELPLAQLLVVADDWAEPPPKRPSSPSKRRPRKKR
jgi:Uma2 family endonuclease